MVDAKTGVVLPANFPMLFCDAVLLLLALLFACVMFIKPKLKIFAEALGFLQKFILSKHIVGRRCLSDVPMGVRG
jgi:hypothetical protein